MGLGLGLGVRSTSALAETESCMAKRWAEGATTGMCGSRCFMCGLLRGRGRGRLSGVGLRLGLGCRV